MRKANLILAIIVAGLSGLACAHAEPPPPPPPETDWGRGLDSQLTQQIAPVGPLESDQRAYELIRRRGREQALGNKLTALELDEIIANSSQVLASAMAMPLFKTGVYLGQPRLIDRACTAARRVTHAALRSSGNIEAVQQACALLTAGKQTSDACGEGQAKLRDAYGLLSQEKGPEAGRAAAEAVRMLRDRCPKIAAPLRTPVDPSSRGFLIVWVLHAQEALPATYLAGETAPSTAEQINEAFLRGVQALRPVSMNP